MKINRNFLTMLLLAAMLVAFVAQARAFKIDLSKLRCSGGVISTGDSQRLVLTKCGPPDSHYAQEGENVWVYSFGESRFVYYFKLMNRRLQRISQVSCDVDNPDCIYFR